MEQTRAFNILKTAFHNSAELAHPGQCKNLCLFTDASDTHWSGILTQIPKPDLDLPFNEQRHEQYNSSQGPSRAPVLDGQQQSRRRTPSSKRLIGWITYYCALKDFIFSPCRLHVLEELCYDEALSQFAGEYHAFYRPLTGTFLQPQ